MIITIKKPYICFVNIPCTDGIYIDEWLGENFNHLFQTNRKNDKIINWNEIYRPYPTIREMHNLINIDKHYIFSLVRNPYDRVYEAFKFLYKNDESFEDTLRNNRKKPDIVYFDTMTNYLHGTTHDIEVFKYEEYDKVIAHINTKFSFKTKIEFPTIEIFKHNNVYEQNKRWISLVNEIYADDFRNFEYEMIKI
jgi:hypothetical protein